MSSYGSRFGVSRATANKALSSLVSKGLLEFRKGVARSYESAPSTITSILLSFTEEALAVGKHPSTQVLRFDTVAAQDVLDEVPEVLRVGPDKLCACRNGGFAVSARLRQSLQRPYSLWCRHAVAKG